MLSGQDNEKGNGTMAQKASLAEGKRARVLFTGTVLPKDRSYPSNTTPVRDPDGNIHYLSLGSSAIREAGASKEPGTVIPVNFTGTARKRSFTPAPSGTARIIDDITATGYTHYLNTRSRYVVREEDEEPADREVNEAPAQPGDKIRVELSGLILNSGNELGTTQVRDAYGYDHYIFLRNAESREQALGSAGTGEPATGSTVAISFLATVRSDPFQPVPAAGTTFITSVSPGYNHFVNLDSPGITTSVTSKPVSKKPEPATAPVGTTVKVELTGTVTNSAPGSLGTTEVTDQDGYKHSLFLSTTARERIVKNPGTLPVSNAIYEVSFTGRIGIASAGTRVPEGTVLVRSQDYNHFVNLDSPGITLAEPKAPAGPKTPGAVPASRSLVFPEMEKVTSEQVSTRIKELRSLRKFTVTRNRDSRIVGSFATRTLCEEFLNTEDLRASRFTITMTELPAAEASELADLSDLYTRAGDLAGLSWTIFGEAHFTATRAQDYARRRRDAGEWPLRYVDWTLAARDGDWRDSQYGRITYRGKRYWYE